MAEEDLATNKLTYEAVPVKHIYKQHEQNPFHRPYGTEVGGLFKADFNDPEGLRLSANKKLEKRFDDYCFTKSAVSHLFDVLLQQFNLIHSFNLGHVACK